LQKKRYTPNSKDYSKELSDKYKQYQNSQQERRKKLLANIETLLEKKWWRDEIKGKKS